MKSKLLAFCISILFATLTVAQTVPTASFSMSTYTACAKTGVQITDLSSNAPTAWSYSVNGTASTTAQSPEIIFTAAGIYTVSLEASNSAGTSSVFSQTLLVNAVPVIMISGNTLVCTSASSTLSASGADTYTWSFGPNTNSVTINPAANTIYTLVGTSTLTGCSDSSFASIFTIPLPTISVSNATICSGNVFTISPSGASTYTYSGGSNTVMPVTNTNYTVSGTDVLTGCSDSVAFSITVNVVLLSASNGTICAGQVFTITPSGATTYTYSGGSNTVSPLVNTSYTVIGNDISTGCTDSIAITVGVIPSPTITVNNGTVCAGNVFHIVPMGASNYTYSGGSNAVTPSVTSIYTITGIDAISGCTSSATLSLIVNPLPTITVNNGTICAGQIFTIMPGGAISYTYSGGSATVMPSSTTSYSVTGTDANGCISQNAAIDSVIVSGVAPVLVITTSGANTICAGQSVVLSASGASTYSWNTGAITATVTINPTITTIFYVTGSDSSHKCSTETSVIQYVSNCTGIDKNSVNNLNFAVYPNPSSGTFNIEVDSEINISIVNALGQVITKQQLKEGKNAVDISHQPAGIYFIHVNQQDQIKTIRIIKQ